MLLEFDDSYLIGIAAWCVFLVGCFWFLLKRRQRAGDRGKTVINACLSVWLLLVMLTGCELYFAFIFDETDSFNMTNVSRKWFRKYVEPEQQALTFSTGETTLYRDDVEFRKPTNDEKHLLFIGDSFTFGHGVKDVSDRFSNVVRARLESEGREDVRVSNLADAGRDLHWVEAMLQRSFDSGIRADVVVYVMCLNDIETFHPRHRTYYTELGQHSPTFFLFRDTYFFNLLYFRLRQFTVPDVKDYYSFVEEYYSSEPWERMQSKLITVNELCESHDSELVVVVFPFLHQLENYRFTAAHSKIDAFCETQKIPVIDLLPALQSHSDEGLTVSRFDAHPNVLAHKLAAERIYEGVMPLVDSDGTAEKE